MHGDTSKKVVDHELERFFSTMIQEAGNEGIHESDGYLSGRLHPRDL